MMTTAIQLRSFVAVPLPGGVKTELAAAAAALARELPGVKWSKKPENFHVTMKFLGLVAVDRLEALGAALGEAVAEVPRFALELHGFGAFPSARDAKVLFVKIVDEQHRLAALAETVETVSARFGLPREARPFTGHVTVGRSKSKEGVDARAALAPRADLPVGIAVADELHVYESQLGGEGSTYFLRQRARLDARA
ncbi:MAG TPA: RNA 2',3'-cyclic phosphodiesterase, partial [Polyangia bacterium]|nr:RNA 2',3'-cyclic phosphodiesterase [Polyangia bacterium]